MVADAPRAGPLSYRARHTGAVVRSVNATGAINAVVTVQMGAFVSGTIRSLSCDYNTRVRANQRCAKVDPRPFQSTVDQNAAALAWLRT